MNKINSFLQRNIALLIDFFYPPFKPYMSNQFFRYGVSGAANMVFDWILFFLFFHYAFQAQIIDFGFYAFEPHTAAFITVFPITLLSGFWLGKYISFSDSKLRGRRQLIRYFFVVICNIFIQYSGIKFFVEFCHFFPTPSKMLITLVSMVFSYVMQKYFTFRT